MVMKMVKQHKGIDNTKAFKKIQNKDKDLIDELRQQLTDFAIKKSK